MTPSPELRDLTLRFYDAATRGDHAALATLYAADALLIGTDPTEWWTGTDTIARVFQAQIEAMGGSMPIVPGDPRAYAEGAVGWAADQPRFRMPDGTEVPFRFTAVFRKEADGWKVVQQHVSIGVPNEEALGKELPT
jgi:ketosteroid isomerase-like protein